MNLEATQFCDHETGNNYLLLYHRELVGGEMKEAVNAFKPKWVWESPGGTVFIVAVDFLWNPAPVS
ncbi:MAG: hypothetical protein ABSB84_06365 [Verrucomicrobiota bacterium]|jgi:hypothetical protein